MVERAEKRVLALVRFGADFTSENGCRRTRPLAETQGLEPWHERSQKRRTNIPMDDFLYEMLLEAKEAAETEWVLEFRGKRARETYHGMIALYKRAGITGLHRHDLRRTAATYVHRGTEG